MKGRKSITKKGGVEGYRNGFTKRTGGEDMEVDLDGATEKHGARGPREGRDRGAKVDLNEEPGDTAIVVHTSFRTQHKPSLTAPDSTNKANQQPSSRCHQIQS